jgi:hypothetical protein
MITFEKFNIPEGAMFSWYQLNNSSPFDEGTDVNYYENWKHFRGAAATNGNELYVEYYEPKGTENEVKIIFDKIFYSASDGIGISLNDILKKKVDTEGANLKSGSWGTSSYDCNNKLPCSSVSVWEGIAKSVVFLRIRLANGDYSLGTGFLINKSSDYSSSDKPYIVTCGHLFEDGVNGNYPNLYCYVNYVDHSCDDIWPRSGKNIGDFDIEEFGLSSNIDPDSSGYYASDDYALLQVNDKDIEDLAKYNVQYAGWTTSHNYTAEGYVYIGHPRGDVKTVNKWDGYAPVNLTEKFFAVYNKVGINEEGFSGSPVFSTISNLVVGWVCTKEDGVFTCGNEDQFTHCGLFDELHPAIRTYVDPTNSGSAGYSNPTTIVLPSHCHDCIENYDEDDIDCGGSCQPCGMADEIYATTTADIYGRGEINARFNLEVDGGGTQVEFQNMDYELNAGENIILKSFKVYNGANFKASVNEDLRFADAQGCQDACIVMSDFVDHTDDGYFDFILGTFAYVERYKVTIKNRWNGLIHSFSWTDVYENGITAIWDGTYVTTPGTYILLIEYYDCYGNYGQTGDYVYVADNWNAKSINLGDEEKFNKNQFKYEIITYPNPVSGELSVSVNKDLLEGEYELEFVDLNGKSLNKCFVTGHTNSFDVSGYIPGIYIVIAKIEDKVYTKKFSKE